MFFSSYHTNSLRIWYGFQFSVLMGLLNEQRSVCCIYHQFLCLSLYSFPSVWSVLVLCIIFYFILLLPLKLCLFSNERQMREAIQMVGAVKRTREELREAKLNQDVSREKKNPICNKRAVEVGWLYLKTFIWPNVTSKKHFRVLFARISSTQ